MAYLNLDSPTAYSSAQTAQPSTGFVGLGQLIGNVSNVIGIPHIGFSDAIAGQKITPTWGTTQAADYNSPNASQQTSSQVPSSFFNQNTGGNGGGGGSPNPVNNNNNNANTGPNPNDLFNQAKDYYNNAYGDLLSGLDPQRSAQENIVNNNFNQSLSDLGATKQQGLADLATQTRKTQEGTVKTLNDLTENLRNQTTAGQVYLGARGAGDSSAANQYAYALTKMGNQNRGNVLSQQNSILADIGDREAKLNNIFTQESSRLETEKNNGLQQIAQWYADAQNQIKQARTQDVGSLSMQALQFAIQGIQNVQNQIATRRQALESWALSNSQTIQEAKSNLQGVSNFMAPAIQGQSLNGTPLFGGGGGSAGPAVGYGSSQQKTDIFGNIIQ